MNRYYVYGLLALVFLTGAAVLIVEVVAMRVLSPYYGNTLHSVSSVLGVILGALSLGYYIGGKLADRYPKTIVFFGLIFVAGISILFLDILTKFALPMFGYLLSPLSGPIVAALALFFVPAFFLGLLSPFAIVLHKFHTKDSGVGNIAGRVFFWSTVGSICGSLAAGFLLIPHLGITAIFAWTGSILTGIGFTAFVWHFVSRKKIGILMTLISCVVFLEAVVITSNLYAPKNNFLLLKDGLYERIGVYEGVFGEKQGRVLMQDRSVGGGIALDTSEHLFPHSKYYELYKLFIPEAKRALVIGGGPYVIPKAFLDSSKDMRVDVAEIEPSLLSVAESFFEFPKHEPRFTNFVVDGRRFLHDTKESYDVIFGDAFNSLFSIPSHLTTQEFFTLARGKLSPNGIFILNVPGSFADRTPSLALSELKTFRSAFPNSYFFTSATFDSTVTQNIMFVGYNDKRNVDITVESMAFDNTFFKELPNHAIDVSNIDLTKHIMLTDNYAPVEYLTAALVRESF